MRKVLTILIIVIAVMALVPWPAKTSTSALTGTITDAQGNPVNGTLIMQLPVPATDVTTGRAVANTPVSYRIVNGVILSGTTVPLYDVNNLQPQNLYYSARAYDSAGNLVLTGNYAVTGTSYNLGAAIPTSVTTSNISYVNPAVTNASNVFCCTQTFQGQIVSTLSTGTPPFSIASTTLVPNLNVNNLNGVTISGTPAINQTLVASSPTAAAWGNSTATLSTYVNNGTGTATNLIAKLTGAPSTVTTVTTGDTGGAIGICVSGCGNSGSASITTVGQASCTFDGATVAGDYVQISGTVAGDCHDAGATFPANGQVLGRILSTNGAGGIFNIGLFGVEVYKPAAGLAYQSWQQTLLGGDVAIAANTTTTVTTLVITMPGAGCPCRVAMTYSMWISTGSSGNGYTMWVSDGANTMFPGNTGQSNGSAGAAAQIFGGGISTVTYANAAVVTFTLTTRGDHTYTVKAAPLNTGAPNSSIQGAVAFSN